MRAKRSFGFAPLFIILVMVSVGAVAGSVYYANQIDKSAQPTVTTEEKNQDGLTVPPPPTPQVEQPTTEMPPPPAYPVKPPPSLPPPPKPKTIITPPPPAVKSSCPLPYHVLNPDGSCIWSCAAGTRQDPLTNECVCLNTSYKEAGKDSLGRRICKYQAPPPLPPSKQTTVSIDWTMPSGGLTVSSGGTINLGWSVTGGDATRALVFYLDHSQWPDAIYDFLSVPASKGSAQFVVEDLPGGTYYLLVAGATPQVTKKIQVTVNAPPSHLDPEESELDFENAYEEDEITADGLCATSVYMSAYDQYGNPLVGQVVNLKSSRGSVDTILPRSPAINDDGEMYFTVSSKTPGIATLSASVNGISFNETLTLNVIAPSEGDCAY